MKGIMNVPGLSFPKLKKILGGYVPATRTINGKSLSENIQLTAKDLGVEQTTMKAIEESTITALFESES